VCLAEVAVAFEILDIDEFVSLFVVFYQGFRCLVAVVAA
jgi:hypothetical protein